jgi:phytoene dehydrogenase-like protein
MDDSIIIRGAGMGGLAAGIYGQVNGYRTEVFEQHSVPGGQCASWKRKGYTFDGCIHHLFGCAPGSRLYGLWEELGAMPRELAPTRECVSVASVDGRLFNDYWDLERLESHLEELSPADAPVIEEYLRAIQRFAKKDFLGESMAGSRLKVVAMAPGMIPLVKWFKPTMAQYARKFSDEFLRSAFPLLEYSLTDAPLMIHLVKHAYGLNKNIAWPVGGANAFAKSIEERYTSLGGEVHYRQPVTKVLTQHGKAFGVRLEDGSEHRASRVICNADGRKAIMGMLEGRYVDDRIRSYCEEPDDETSWAVHVFLGVARDLSEEPSALVQLLEKPVTIGGHEHSSLEMQTYGMDPTMAPVGKGVIKVELVASYSYWKALHANRELYDEEKEKVAAAAIDILDRTRYPGIKSQVEAIDVPTLMTWERYVGGTHGFASMPKKKFNPLDMMLGRLDSTLPGLSDFYLVGTWATSAGALFANALSGRKIVKELCGRDGKTFTAR